MALKDNGWTDSEILKALSPCDFAPNYDFIAIASITGTYDNIFPRHSKCNLESAIYYESSRIFKIPSWIRTKNYEGKIDLLYNPYSEELKWKKMNM